MILRYRRYGPGGAFGIAILATVAADKTGASTSATALVDGYQAAFTLAAALMVAAFVVAAVVLRRGPARASVAESAVAAA